MQFLGPRPVGGDASLVEQAGRGGEERSRAHRHEPPGAWGGVGDVVDEALVVARRIHSGAAGEEQHVERPVRGRRQRVGAQPQAALGDDLPAVDRHDVEAISRSRR